MVKNIVVFIASFLVGMSIFVGARWVLIHTQFQAIISPKAQSKFSIATAPTKSLTAHIESFSGNVVWQSRVAKEGSRLTGLVTLQQEDRLETKDDGTIAFSFPDNASVRLSPASEIHIVQTLPANIVIDEKQGVVEYASQSEAIPFSVRGLDLLIQVIGDSVVTVDKKKSTVTVRQKSGKARLAYNDSDTVSHIITLESGRDAVFVNDTKRLMMQ